MFPFKSKKKQPLHVLIVDDEKDFLSSMETWFKSQGYAVETAANGLEALEILKKQEPSIIFMDIRMPEMDGMEALKRVKKIRPKVPVVILTAHGEEDMRVEAYKLGANAFLEKSLDFYKVENVVNSLVRVVSKEKG